MEGYLQQMTSKTNSAYTQNTVDYGELEAKVVASSFETLPGAKAPIIISPEVQAEILRKLDNELVKAVGEMELAVATKYVMDYMFKRNKDFSQTEVAEELNMLRYRTKKRQQINNKTVSRVICKYLGTKYRSHIKSKYNLKHPPLSKQASDSTPTNEDGVYLESYRPRDMAKVTKAKAFEMRTLEELEASAEQALSNMFKVDSKANRSSRHFCWFILKTYIQHRIRAGGKADRTAVVRELASVGIKTVRGLRYTEKHLSDTLIHCFNIRDGKDKTK
jgi:hypothetical protein